MNENVHITCYIVIALCARGTRETLEQDAIVDFYIF